MKIALISNDYIRQFPLEGYGGIEICVETLAFGLHARGADFFVITPRRDKVLEYAFKVIDSREDPTLISGRHASEFAKDCKRILQEEKPDIIWSQSHWSADVLSELGVPIICTFHDSCKKQPGWIKKHAHVKYRFLSLFSYNNWVTEDWERQVSFVCPSGFLDKDYDFGFPENREDYYLWVAGLNWGKYNKGLDFFMALPGINKKDRFVAYGVGNKKLEQELLKYQRKHANFCYSGELKRGEEHSSVFKKAKAFIMPTRIQDCFPRTVIEAMSKGTPVIGFSNGAISEMIGNDIGGVLVNSLQDMGSVFNINWDYKRVFDWSKRFHINHEIDKMMDESKGFYKG